MPPLNWKLFEQLAGSEEKNFELLCRALTRKQYGRFGRFLSLANQPGVEFHLQLETSCSLGDPPRWFGWQCRWYDLGPGRALSTTRRSKIEKSLITTLSVLSGLTDWVLWTRHTLTKRDQDWFYSLPSKLSIDVRLHLWTAAEVEELLTGEAELLRSTYFGELVLLPGTLGQLHENSIQRVKKKWLPDVHQITAAEKELRRMLGQREFWSELTELSNRLEIAANQIEKAIADISERLKSDAVRLVKEARVLAGALTNFYTGVEGSISDLLANNFGEVPSSLSVGLVNTVRRLRSTRQGVSLVATNLLVDMKVAVELLNSTGNLLGTRIIGVLADAGSGKTQLAAQLTQQVGTRPAGVLIYGQDLHAGDNLNDLAANLIIPGVGKGFPSMEALIAAVDAAAERSRRRIPIVIDGLNEAQDPRDWKGPLSTIKAVLEGYPHVLLVCTLRSATRLVSNRNPWALPVEICTERTAFVQEALPDDVRCLEMFDFDQGTPAAIAKYFEYYKINPGDVVLPDELLSRPLTLRLFCEVTNGERRKEVGVEKIPGSEGALFEEYLRQASVRISDLSTSTFRHFEHDVRKAIEMFGSKLWEDRSRSVDQQALRKLLEDTNRPWNESIIRALEQEGIIIRIPGRALGEIQIVALYDALAGHVVANSLISMCSRAGGLDDFIRKPENIALLSGIAEEPEIRTAFLWEDEPAAVPSYHPLSIDIFRALVALVPRRLHGKQLWTLLDEPLRAEALRRTAFLEAAYLDGETITALKELVRSSGTQAGRLYWRFFQTRGAVAHPLNSHFLDQLLRTHSVADRDLSWSEWIRNHIDTIREDVREREISWKTQNRTNHKADSLRARWVMWLLTSTNLWLRDEATRALYWYGRGNPSEFLELLCDSLTINDPYVCERMLAAGYGAAMALYQDPTFTKQILPLFASKIFNLVFAEDAPCQTTHVLSRDYARRIIKLAMGTSPAVLSEDQISLLSPPYSFGKSSNWPEAPTVEGAGAWDSPLHMDFENYILGLLVPGRGNYERQHPEFVKLRSQILWRISQLGWSVERFGRLDQRIAQNESFRIRIEDGRTNKTERYGKKYSWIAFYEMNGILHDQQKIDRYELDYRCRDLDVDPSFPINTPAVQIVATKFVSSSNEEIGQWIDNGPTPDVASYLVQGEIDQKSGPWVALDGAIVELDLRRSRRMFCFIRGFFVRSSESNEILRHIEQQDLGGRWLPETPRSIYTMAGEIPWADTFPEDRWSELPFVIGNKIVTKRRRSFIAMIEGKEVNLTPFDLYRLAGEPVPPSEPKTGLPEEDLARVELYERQERYQETEPKIKNFKALIPVRDFGWEGRDVGEKVRATVLAKQIARTLKLVGKAQTFDLFDRDGKQASVYTANYKDYNNNEDFLFIRKDLLQRYLHQRKLTLIWAVWGERQYHSARRSFSYDPDAPKKPYKVFQTTLRFTTRGPV